MEKDILDTDLIQPASKQIQHCRRVGQQNYLMTIADQLSDAVDGIRLLCCQTHERWEIDDAFLGDVAGIDDRLNFGEDVY